MFQEGTGKSSKASEPFLKHVGSAVFYSTVVVTGLLLTPHKGIVQCRSLRLAASP